MNMRNPKKYFKRLIPLSIIFSVLLIAWKNFDLINTIPNIDTNFKDGTPYSTFYSTLVSNDQISAIVEDSTETMFFGGKLGITEFDSYEQRLINTNGRVLNLFRATNGTIFVICNNSFGKIKNTDTGHIYTPLFEFSNKNTIQNNQIIQYNNKIYFHQNNLIGIYNLKKSKMSVFDITDNNNVDNICLLNNKLYYYSANLGFSEIQDTNISSNLIEFNKISNYTVPISSDSTFIITSDNLIYLYNKNKFILIEKDKYSYLSDKVITNVVKIGSNIAFCTLNGGVIFYNYKSGLFSVMDIYSGLSDNLVYSIGFDHNRGMWIATKKGLYRYDFSIPIKEYSYYIGLDGEIFTTTIANKTLYVFTNKGVYYLTSPQNIQEISKLKKNDNSDDITTLEINKKQQAINTKTTSNKSNTTKTNIIKRWTQKLFKRKKKNQTTDSIIPPQDTTNIYNQQTKVIKKQTPKKNTNQNIKFIKYYKKIDLISNKTTSIATVGNKIYVGTTKGLYLINGTKAKQIIKDEYVTSIILSKNGYLLVATINGLYKLFNDNSYKKIIDIEKFNSFIYSMIEDSSNFWLATQGTVYKLNKDFYNLTSYQIDPNFLQRIVLLNIANKIFAYTTFGIFKYYEGLDKFEIYRKFSKKTGPTKFIKSENDAVWYKVDNKWHFQSNKYQIDSSLLYFLPLFDNIIDIKFKNKFLWIITNNNKIYKIDKKELKNYYQNIRLKKVVINNQIFTQSNLEIPYIDNLTAKIEIAAPSYLKPNSRKFQYAITTNNAKQLTWISAPTNIFEVNLNVGTQYIYFRSKDIFGNYSDTQKIRIKVKPPFYQTRWFAATIIFLIILFITLIAYIRQRVLQRKNEMLEKIVAQRTAEIRQKNEELENQKEEILRQNEILQKQKQEISKSHQYITKSINYASRIQNAILPDVEIIANFFSDYFILFLPRDVVSGDFYWFKDTVNKLFIVLSDCTGHGVPGAFLSMLGTAYLNDIVSLNKNLKANEYLNIMRISILNSLKENDNQQIRDGMDMAFCIIDKQSKKLNFAGAKQNFYYVRDKKLHIAKGDKMPIGYYKIIDKEFTEYKINLQKDDIIYLFSDGYGDQLGGDFYQKIQQSKFKEILLEIASFELAEQKEILIEVHKKWKGNYEQTDDITIIGLKL